MRLVAHRLNIVATKEVKDVFENSICKKIFRLMMAKSQAAFNKQSRSILASDKIQDLMHDLLVILNVALQDGTVGLISF